MKNLTLLFLLLSFSVFSQKKSYQNLEYYLENGEKISQTEFFKILDHRNNIDISFYKSDSVHIKILFERIRKGKLTEEQFDQLKLVLRKHNPRPFQTEQVVIEYMTANPNKHFTGNLLYALNKPTNRKVTKKHKSEFYYISNPNNFPEINQLNNNFRTWLKDEDNFISNLFYPVDTFFGNVTVISNDGKCITYLGEHSPENVYELLEEIKKL